MGAPGWARLLLVLGLAAAPLAPAAALADPTVGLSVQGSRLLEDGAPFLARGFNMIGLLAPDWCARTAARTAGAHLGAGELAAARDWDATTLRFQVSQRGLGDPTIAADQRETYLQEIQAGVAQARAAGFVVILSMQDQALGCGTVHPLPSDQTVAAWDLLAPAFQDDPYVMFELFNEPVNQPDTAGWAQWRDGGSTPNANLGAPAVGHQQLVEHLRELGVLNVLIADVALRGERGAGLPPLADPAGQLVYGIHPYVYTQGPAWWDLQFGSLTAIAPVLATEWNYLAGDCGRAPERLAPDLLGYLRDHGIGVLGHAFDALRTTVADWSWTPTRCGSAVGGSGQVLRSFFAGLRDRESPPTAPAGLRATDVASRQVTLAWDPSTDDVGVTGYQVLRDGVVIGTASTTGFTDTGVVPEEGVTYTVRALDAGGGVSPDSAELDVTTPPAPADTTPPSTPAGFTARVASPTSVVLGWRASTDDVGVTAYTITRDTTPVGVTTGLGFTDIPPTPGPHTYQVSASDAAGNTSHAATATVNVPAPAPAGLTGSYFDTATLTVQKLTRIDRTVNFAWGTRSPAPGIATNTFSVRWTGQILPTADGSWTFYTRSDDGVRLWIDGRPVIDHWTTHALMQDRGSIPLTASQAHTIRLEYADRTGSATIKLLWSGPGTATQVIPATRLLAN
jgi:hypothetical protein